MADHVVDKIVKKMYGEDDEKLYLVHGLGCGEVFDDMTIAFEHAATCEYSPGNDNDWQILPESEAF